MTIQADRYNFALTEHEQIMLGKRHRVPKPKKLHIVIPMHYGAKGVWWESRMIAADDLDSWQARYPDLQVVGERSLSND